MKWIVAIDDDTGLRAYGPMRLKTAEALREKVIAAHDADDDNDTDLSVSLIPCETIADLKQAWLRG